jgi:hypothetical protein
MNGNFSLDINALMPDNQAVRDLSELIFLNVLEPGKLDQILDINLGVRNGQRVAIIHPMPEVMEAMQGCNPDYNTTQIPTSEQVWVISGFGIYERICANDIIGTIMKYMRDKGIDSDDLTQDEFTTKILRPMLEEKIVEEIFRIAIFGDTTLSVYDSVNNTTGKLQPGKQAKNWNFMDGIWKRLEVGVANGQIKRVIIPENAAATYELQDAFITTAGAAKGVLINMKHKADMVLRTAQDRQFVVTQSFADAIEYDILINNGTANYHLEYTELFAGIKVTEILGEKVLVVPQLDAIIASSFENITYPGAANYLPHRAIFYSLQNLKWATESGGYDAQGKSIPPRFAELKVWYDEKSEETYFKVKDTMGTAVSDPRLVVVAY